MNKSCSHYAALHAQVLGFKTYNLRHTKDVFRISCARSSVEETRVEMLGRKGKQFDPTSSDRNVNRLASRLLHEATPAVS